MIRRSPCELYIKYLVVHPAKYADADIKGILEYAGLDYTGAYYLSRLRRELQVPTNFQPNAKSHKPSQDFVLAHGLSKFFRRHPDFLSAKAILENPPAKEMLETLIINGMPVRSIVFAMRKKLRVELTESAVEFYERAFWNLKLIDSIELKALLHQRYANLEAHPDPEIAAQGKALKRAHYSDPRIAAAHMPRTPMSASMSLLKLGIMPSAPEVHRLLETIQVLAYARTLEALTQDGIEDSTRAANYINIARTAIDISERVVRPDEQLRQQLYALTLKTESQSVPLIAELSGTHTLTLAPEPSNGKD